MVFANIFFSWLVIMIAINIYRGIIEKSNKGGRRMKKRYRKLLRWE